MSDTQNRRELILHAKRLLSNPRKKHFWFKDWAELPVVLKANENIAYSKFKKLTKTGKHALFVVLQRKGAHFSPGKVMLLKEVFTTSGTSKLRKPATKGLTLGLLPENVTAGELRLSRIRKDKAQPRKEDTPEEAYKKYKKEYYTYTRYAMSEDARLKGEIKLRNLKEAMELSKQNQPSEIAKKAVEEWKEEHKKNNELKSTPEIAALFIKWEALGNSEDKVLRSSWFRGVNGKDSLAYFQAMADAKAAFVLEVTKTYPELIRGRWSYNNIEGFTIIKK